MKIQQRRPRARELQRAQLREDASARASFPPPRLFSSSLSSASSRQFTSDVHGFWQQGLSATRNDPASASLQAAFGRLIHPWLNIPMRAAARGVERQRPVRGKPGALHRPHRSRRLGEARRCRRRVRRSGNFPPLPHPGSRPLSPHPANSPLTCTALLPSGAERTADERGGLTQRRSPDGPLGPRAAQQPPGLFLREQAKKHMRATNLVEDPVKADVAANERQ